MQDSRTQADAVSEEVISRAWQEIVQSPATDESVQEVRDWIADYVPDVWERGTEIVVHAAVYSVHANRLRAAGKICENMFCNYKDFANALISGENFDVDGF